jgi:putative transposase
MFGEVFDPKADRLVYSHDRPHWSQAGAITFITFRTADSIPRDVLENWDRDKLAWLATRGYPDVKHWSQVLNSLCQKDRADFNREFHRTREVYLDTCQGRCLLKRPDLAQIVADALLHFDGDRYSMGDFVVMPNHVHLLASFPTADAMKVQCNSWLHYTAFRINRAMGIKGKFWQQEPFDHLVRSEEQLGYLRKYVAENPNKANLKAGEFLYHRA